MSTPVYTNMAPSAQDPFQVLICKAAYWAQTIAEAAGIPLAPGMYPNMTPFAQDPLQVLAVKLTYWLEQIALAIGGGGGGALQVFDGHGAPVGLQVGQNPLLAAIYNDLDAPHTQYIWTGATWV